MKDRKLGTAMDLAMARVKDLVKVRAMEKRMDLAMDLAMAMDLEKHKEKAREKRMGLERGLDLTRHRRLHKEKAMGLGLEKVSREKATATDCRKCLRMRWPRENRMGFQRY